MKDGNRDRKIDGKERKEEREMDRGKDGNKERGLLLLSSCCCCLLDDVYKKSYPEALYSSFTVYLLKNCTHFKTDLFFLLALMV